MPKEFSKPDFSFEAVNYLKRPWKLGWRLRSLQRLFGKEFVRYHRFLSDSIYWSREQINEYQWQRLKELLDHAYRTVPFYREQFKQLGITPDDIRTLADFSQLPIITRDHLRENVERFKSSEFEKHRGSTAYTSGTSGNVLTFYRSWFVESMRRAVQWRHFNQIGYRFKQRRVMVSVPFMGDDSNLLYKFDPIENALLINGTAIGMERGDVIYQLINKFNPVLLYGHPSGVTALATMVKLLGLKSLNIPVAYTISEALESHARKRISQYVSSNIHDHYGNRENTISASEMCCGNYHINSEFVYQELVPSDEKLVEGEYYRVIGTCLNNYAMPLIRYDADDLARGISTCDNPECRIKHPTIEFVGGRTKNFVVTRDGLLYCQFDDWIVYENFNFLEEYQIIQHDLDNLTLKLVPAGDYQKERDEPKLTELLHKTTNGLFKLRVEYVDEIPHTKAFKKLRVISLLAQEELKRS